MAGLQGIPGQLAQILFGAGLDQKSDARESSPPTLDICQNIEFDEVANARTRKPYGLESLNVIGGGLVTDTGQIRRIVPNGDELVLFTATALYSWVPSENAWALRSTHLAVAVDEDDEFGINGDQTSIDRAELNGVVVMAWVSASFPWIAAFDKTTGATILPATGLDVTGHPSDAVKLVALGTKILAVWRDTALSEIRILSLDTSNLAGSIVVPTALTAPGTTGVFDAVRIPGADSAVVVVGETSAQYQVFKVSSALGVTSSTKARGGNTAIACSVDPTGTWIQVARTASTAATSVVGDLLVLATLADSITGQAIGTITGTAVTHIACAHRLVKNGGFYRCYVFWTQDESSVGSASVNVLKTFQSKVNWVDTNGALGAQANFIADLGLASGAFAYGSSVFVCGVFAGVPPVYSSNPVALQNTIFVCRDDGRIVAKTCVDRAAGLLTTKCLPSVALTSGSTVFSYGANVRRRVVLPQGSTYSGRAPCSVTFSFDDNRARRCVRLGKTLYVSGGQIRQYDGVTLAELGWPIYTWCFTAAPNAGGTIPAGAYTFKVTSKSTNAVGEVDRCTTATTATATTVGAGSLLVHLKPNYYGERTLTSNLEVWRTQINPTADAPFFLVTSLDPTVIAGSNCYIANDPTLTQIDFVDALPDSFIAANQADPEIGLVLESLAPPPATIITANDTRVFLAGIAGQPDVVWYSKTRNDGEVVSFNDALTVQVPAVGGAITAVLYFNRSLVVFRETAIYVYVGDGLDNTGGGQNYSLAKTIPNCGAVNAEAVAMLDDSLLFKSDNGWYRLDQGWTLSYVGGPVVDFDADEVYGIDVLTSQHQIRITTERRIVLYDTLVRQWGEWTELAVGSCMWNGTHTLISASSVSFQRTDFVGITYGWDLEFTWWKPNDLQGRALVRGVQLLGEWRGSFSVRVRVARNYQTDLSGWAYNQNKVVPVTDKTVGASLQLKVAPKLKRGEAFKFRFTALAPDQVSAPAGDTAKLSGIAIAYALEDGLYNGLSAAQRA